MCKVLIVPKVNGPKAIEFIKLMGQEMSPGNKDGLGYAAVDKDGKLFGERWLNNDEAFSTVKDPEIQDFSEYIEGWKTKGESNSFGETPDINKAVAVTLHTRMATTAKGMTNTHPFVHDDTSLIHNGVIHNYNEFKLKVSTCDSEAILVSYLDQGVNLDPSKINQVANSFTGYYACGVFSRDAQGNRILDVFKGNNDRLFLMYIKELETHILTTSYADADVVCRKMGLSKTDYYKLKDGQLLRFNPLTGKLMLSVKFEVGSSYSNWTRNVSSNSSENKGTIIDASTSGNKNKLKNLSDKEIDFYKLIPSFRELSQAEVVETIREYNNLINETA